MEISASGALTGSYDYGEVARSILIAIAASYAALDLAGRVTAAKSRARALWLACGAIAMGIGIWEMHFKGMLAFHLPVPVEYHWPTVLASLLVAILASAVALYVASRQKMGWVEALTGSVVMGAGIAGMHYIGMAAMRLPATTRYSPILVTCSLLLAILFSLIALLMAFDLREETRWSVPRRLGSAMVMGVAVSAMHYTGMAAASFIPAPSPGLSYAVSISPLANNGIAIVTLIVILAAMVTSSVDRWAAFEAQRLNQELERRVLERTSQLTAVNEELAKTEERFRKLVEALPDALYVHSENKIVFVNPFGMRLLGAQQPEQLVGKGILEIVHPDYRDFIRQRIQHCYQTGTASSPMECALVALDGSFVEVESAGIPITWKGSPAIEVVARDIRERKRSEARLREYEEAVEGLEEMICVVDREYRYVLANRAFLNYRGMEREELVGRLVPELLDPGVFETVIKGKFDECFQGKVVNHELTYNYPHLGDRDLLISYFPIEGPNGVDRVACILQDVTERNRAERTVQEWQKRLELAAKAGLRIGLWDWDLTANTVIWSDETYRQWGYTRDMFSGRVEDVVTRIHPDDLPRVEEAIRKVLAGGPEYAAQYRVVLPDGTTCWIDAYGVLVRDGTTHMIGIGIDITDLKKTEQSLQEAKMELARVSRIVTMGELTASIAHEINQPLAAVATNASASLHWLAAQPPNLDEARQAMVNAMTEASRASGVIERLRTLLKKVPPQLRPVDVNEVIVDVLTLAHRELITGGVAIHTQLAADLPTVLGDRIQLQQVMLNLIMNAIDAMLMIKDRPRTLLIKSVKDAEDVRIEVHDSGKGIDPEHASRIFDSFFTTKQEGIGMGLSISRSIVEAHGGRLRATPGSSHGAVFQMILPKAA
ncbi:MAG: MHYT domain-containing protein [Terriglobales bacterium]